MAPHKKASLAKSPKKIVVIGGGTGVFSVLSGLREYDLDLTAIVTMADDGGSTGILREEFGILPPGDIRRALLALSHSDNRMMAELLNYRFSEGAGLRGHNFGNLLITALERITGDFSKAIGEVSKILNVRGKVIPVTLDKARLCAELEDGTVVNGETNIDIPSHNGHLKINKIWLKPRAVLNPQAKKALLAADAVLIGPGDLYTSVMPNLVVEGFSDALRASRGKKVYISNIMTKFGETNGFQVGDFIKVVNSAIGEDVLSYVLVNTRKPNPARLKKYAEEKAAFVQWENLPAKPLPIFGDFLRDQGFLRHDPQKVAKTILSFI